MGLPAMRVPDAALGQPSPTYAPHASGLKHLTLEVGAGFADAASADGDGLVVEKGRTGKRRRRCQGLR